MYTCIFQHKGYQSKSESSTWEGCTSTICNELHISTKMGKEGAQKILFLLHVGTPTPAGRKLPSPPTNPTTSPKSGLVRGEGSHLSQQDLQVSLFFPIRLSTDHQNLSEGKQSRIVPELAASCLSTHITHPFSTTAG